MQFLSVCSGIEAASVAWSPLGFEALAFSEIEPFPSAVLKHHYPNTPNLGDMTLASQWTNYEPDILVGGTPCQSFSVAGLRKGLADPRGNLMLTYLAIADRYQPEWIVWENVPGVLSSGRGRDFGTFLGALGQIGYGWAYRVLDAQFFGVPQRRRRVFVVGHLGDWRRAAAVLFERHSLQGNPPPSRKAGQEVSATVTSGAANGGPAHGQRSGHAREANLIPAICVSTGQAGAEIGIGIGTTLNCNHEAPYIAHSLRGEGFDASEDGTGRGTPLVPVPFDTTQITSKANRSNPKPGDPCHPLAAGMHPPAIAFQNRGSNVDANGEISGTIGCNSDRASGGAPCIAFDCKASGQNGFGVGEIASTLRSMGHAGSHQNGGRHQAVAFQSSQSGVRIGELHATLDSNNGSRRHNGVVSGMQARRLTPMECERLQGFPDDYTLIPMRGKPAADGPRYKALGNSMAVPVMRWIGERIQLVDWLHS